MTEGRKNLGAWVVAMLGPLVALLLFVGGGAASVVASRRVLETFKETGIFAWILIGSTLVGIVAIAAIAALLLWRQRLCSWLLMLPGITVLLVAAAGMRWSMSIVDRAIAGESLDPSQKARIFAQGVSEASGSLILGGLSASLLLAASTVSIAGRSLSRTRSVRFGVAPIGAFVAAIVLLIVDIAARLFARQLTLFGWHAALLGMAATVLAAAAASGEPDDGEASGRATADLLTIGMVAVTASLAAALSLRSHLFALALGAAAGASVDPSQRLRILATGWSEAGSVLGWSLLDASPAFGGMLLALVLLKRRSLEGLRYSRIALVAVPLLTAVGIAVPYQYAGRTVASIPRLFAVKVPAGFTLVELASPRSSPAGGGTMLWVGPSELLLEGAPIGPASKLDGEQGCEEIAARLKAGMSEYDTLGVALDASTPWSRAACFGQAWARQWDAAARKPRVSWIGTAAGATEKLPPPFDQMGPSLVGVETELTDRGPAVTTPHVHVEKDAVTVVTGDTPERRQGDRAALESWIAQVAREGMHLSGAPDATVSRVLGFAQPGSRGTAVELGFRSPEQVTEWRAFIASIGTVGIRPGGGGPPRARQPVRLETLRVNGRLPPEVIRRIIMRELPRLRSCFEESLKRDPKRAGKLTVRLVINREGMVAAASDGGNDLHDEPLVGCVLRAFKSMQFPAPEGGIVVVQAPVSFGGD